MPNPYFRFKQFVIHQDRTAMKVCTDSCMLGSWTSNKLQGAKTILDIGTGTGLLPLMLAQKSAARLDTIEADPDAAAQAAENIKQSPWPDQVHLITGDVRKHTFSGSYDFIITNPPFFESDLLSPNENKNRAKHSHSLSLDELLTVIRSSLHPSGAFSILLPFHRTAYFEKLAMSNRFFLNEKLIIRQRSAHPPFRCICMFSYQKSGEELIKEMVIKDENGKYSPEFTELMKDYYE